MQPRRPGLSSYSSLSMAPRRPLRRRRRNPLGVIIALLLIAACVALGVYGSLVIMLMHGIVMVTHGLQAHPDNSSQIAWGIVRIVFCELPAAVGFIAASLAWAVFGDL
jgi:hypothetical protein